MEGSLRPRSPTHDNQDAGDDGQDGHHRAEAREAEVHHLRKAVDSEPNAEEQQTEVLSHERTPFRQLSLRSRAMQLRAAAVEYRVKQHAAILRDNGDTLLPSMGAGVLGFDPALLSSIAQRVGTPVYVYSANLIRAQYHALQDALKDVPHRICYSVKANGNLGVLRVLKALGAGADIVSAGELKRALAAGFDPQAIVFSGVGKTRPELVEAMRVGVGFLNIESASELDAVIAAARDARTQASVGIRVNPDVGADTHPYTKTGEKTAKFGVPFDEVVSLARRIAAERSLVLRALAMHLGSQIHDVEPYSRGTAKLLELVTAIRASGIDTLEALDVGGGLGVRYHNEKAPSPQAFAEAVAPKVKAADLALVCEPGRYLVANPGV